MRPRGAARRAWSNSCRLSSGLRPDFLARKTMVAFACLAWGWRLMGGRRAERTPDLRRRGARDIRGRFSQLTTVLAWLSFLHSSPLPHPLARCAMAAPRRAQRFSPNSELHLLPDRVTVLGATNQFEAATLVCRTLHNVAEEAQDRRRRHIVNVWRTYEEYFFYASSAWEGSLGTSFADKAMCRIRRVRDAP